MNRKNFVMSFVGLFLAYCLLCFGAGAIDHVTNPNATEFMSVTEEEQYYEDMTAPIGGVFLVGYLVLTYHRFKNMGRSGWWTATAFVPIFNWYSLGLCLFCKPNSSEVKAVDEVEETLRYPGAGWVGRNDTAARHSAV